MVTSPASFADVNGKLVGYDGLYYYFHANGIEIAFPQRDLHIKDAVPLRIYKETPHEYN
jgi:small-conductance mechanosensitive channel